MFIIRWVSQTCFGPFTSSEEAISWAERKFGADWRSLENLHCHYVEPAEK